MCAKARTIVGYYKRSSTARARLQEIQKQLSVDPPLELLKTAVTVDLTENDSVEDLTNGEWRQVSAFVTTVLQPVEEATTAACAESYPTLFLVVPLVHCMKLLLCDKTSDCDEYDFAQNLLKSIKARFPADSAAVSVDCSADATFTYESGRRMQSAGGCFEESPGSSRTGISQPAWEPCRLLFER
ncbi:hypothetical protein HPB52_001668 [Rhipicephalus sanguineus]|uniref:Uncharacterized protein n=1 Tax=Rhipicephalus sanguineus TaxID=34632 RepID=A0A9D4T2N7_RHISA|nr:hypothetical protein HPB52_001668 [Rhipicephalus sanguineus]